MKIELFNWKMKQEEVQKDKEVLKDQDRYKKKV